MRVLASGFLRLKVFGSGAGFWVSGGVAFLLSCGFWVSVADTFRLWSKYFAGAAGGGQNVPTAAQQGAAPDRRQFGSFYGVSALLVVGRDWAAAGELGRSAAARNLAAVGTRK